MKLGTKARYAVMAMTDIAMNSDESKPINIVGISLRNNLPISYLEQIFVKLRRNNLVHSNRGSSGGYILAKPASEISVKDILNAVENAITATGCGGKTSCRGNGVKCLNHHMWTDLELKINNYLSTLSLDDMVHNKGKNNDIF